MGKLSCITPSSQQMLIMLLIALQLSTALTKLTELNFRSCYQRAMKAGNCASVWPWVGTVIESHAECCSLQVSASLVLQISAPSLPAPWLGCSFQGTARQGTCGLAEAAETLVLVEH